MSARAVPNHAHRFTLTVLLTLLLTTAATIAGLAQGREERPQYVPGQVIVKYKPQARNIGQRTLDRRVRASLHSSIRLPRSFLYRVEGMSVPEAVEALRQDPDIEYAEPNYVYALSAIPNDPSFGSLWGLRNTGQTGGTAGADIGATRAWDFTTGSRSIMVAVIDNGTEYDHADLDSNMWVNPNDGATPQVNDFHGWDFGNNDNDPRNYETNPYTLPYHGTHVAGTIGAVGNNSIGVTGVAWRVTILPLKAQDDGYPLGITLSAAVNAIDYAIAVGARVINNSWGSADSSETLRQALLRADSAGVIVVCAAGNNRRDNDDTPFYPASFNIPNIVSVAATDDDDLLWVEPVLTPGSNWGAASVDLAAPGVNIYSTYRDDLYGTSTGSSMAAPQVAGAFALLLSQFPTLSAYDAIDRMFQYVDSLPSLAGKMVTGGRLNIGRAIFGVDSLPPDAITDLAHSKISSNWVRLRWTSPDDVGYLQRPARYNLRYSTSPINSGNFTFATPASGLPIPSTAGSLDSVVVDSLSTTTQYYFALTSLDEAGNESLLSNVDTVTTLGPPTATEAPNPVTATVLTGATTDVSFKLKNTGGGGLDYSVAAPGVAWAKHTFGAVSSTGTLFAGDSVQWLVHLDALARPSGLSSGSFVITTNDPYRTSITVNLQMTVTSAPDVAVRPGSYDFGSIFVGHSRTKTFQISNPGTQTLSVSSIGTSHGDYDASPSSLTIPAGDSGAVEVVFAPTSTSTGNATLDLSSNDPDEGTVHINLLGDVLDVSVSPVAVTDTVCVGDRVVHEVSVINNSAVSVSYQIRSAAGSTPSLSEDESDPAVTGMRVLYPTSYSNNVGGYLGLLGDLGTRGAEVVDSDDSLTVELLRNFHILWLPMNYTTWTAAERGAVGDWVQAGGTLLVTAVGAYEASFEALADSIGANLDLTFDVTSRDQVDEFATHPTTAGLGYLVTGSTLGHLTVGSPSLPLLYDQGDTLGAYAQIGAGRVVALAGDYFGGSTQYDPINSGDNLTFARQIFDWLADAVWLASNPMSGTIASSATADLDVTLDGTRLSAGTRSRDLVVVVSAPDTAQFVVPVTLKTGVPDILQPGNITYGNVAQGTSSTKTAKIKNTGTCALEVTAVDLSAYFTWAGPGSSFSPVSIAPGDSFTCTIRFTPEYQGFHYGTFTIISNDPDANEDTVTVNLQGKGFGYQYAAVSVGAPQEIVIKNDRQTDLQWRLIGARTEQPPVVGYTLSNASPPAVTKLAEGATSGKDALRFLSNARIAYTGKATTLTRDLEARGATMVQLNRPIESIAGYNVLWISSDAPIQSEEREVVANWVRDGGALMLEGALPFETSASSEALVGGGLLAFSSEATNRFGEWLEYGAGAIVRVEPSAIRDSELEQRSHRLAANQALDWLIPADWLSFQTVAGVTNPGATSKVGVRPGQLPLPNGEYTFEVMAFTNNPEQSRISIPIQFTFGPREDLSRPTVHALRQSAPNPMTTSTRIAFDLPLEEHVRLEVFDVNGRSVRTLVDGTMPAGRHQVEWGARGANGNRVAAGVYFYRVKTPSYNAVKKLVVTE